MTGKLERTVQEKEASATVSISIQNMQPQYAEYLSKLIDEMYIDIKTKLGLVKKQ